MHQLAKLPDVATSRRAVPRSSFTSSYTEGLEEPGIRACGITLLENLEFITACNVFLASRGLPVMQSHDGFNFGNRFH